LLLGLQVVEGAYLIVVIDNIVFFCDNYPIMEHLDQVVEHREYLPLVLPLGVELPLSFVEYQREYVD